MALKLFALRWIYFGVRAPGGAFVPDTWNLFDALIVLGATPRHDCQGRGGTTLGGYTRGTASTPVIVLGATPRHRHHGGPRRHHARRLRTRRQRRRQRDAAAPILVAGRDAPTPYAPPPSFLAAATPLRPMARARHRAKIHSRRARNATPFPKRAHATPRRRTRPLRQARTLGSRCARSSPARRRTWASSR